MEQLGDLIGHMDEIVGDEGRRRSDEIELARRAREKRRDDWLLPEERKALNDVLCDVWDDAEANEDHETAEKAKAALTFLGLPWVRL